MNKTNKKIIIPDAAAAGGQIARPLGIYIHFPFCVRKCAYCDFLSFPGDEAMRQRYVEALIREIKSSADRVIPEKGAEETAGDYRAVSLFLGGGTPSLLSGKQMEAVLQAVYDTFHVSADAEITMECNPGTVREDTLRAYRSAGINRLSFGVQAVQNDLLQTLGRIHTWEMFLESWDLSEKAGFVNRSVDLMSGLPGQTEKMWEQTLEMAVSLHPQHISAYGLIIEEGTPFWKLYHEDEKRRDQGEHPKFLPDEETDRRMYRRTKEMLAAYGYERYEFSNYAKPGYESRHNIGYWKRREYRGFGLGAASQVGQMRFRDTDKMGEYLQAFGADSAQKTMDASYIDREMLTKQDCMEETMYLGLRMMTGVDLHAFEEQFGCSLESIYGDVLRRLQRQGLLTLTDTHAALTERGIDISNAVLAEFLL